MEDSIFVTSQDKTTPLLSGYEPLQASDPPSASQSIENDGPTSSSSHWPSLPYSTNSVENCLMDIYRYYWQRGLWRFIFKEIGDLLIISWLVGFCIFLGTSVDFSAIARIELSKDISRIGLWSFIHFGGPLTWYFTISLILYCIYVAWRIAKFLRDIRRFVRIRVFYRDVLHLTDFDLRTARWADVLQRLALLQPIQFEILRIEDCNRMKEICGFPELVSSIITKRENTLKRLLEFKIIDSSIRFRNWEMEMLTRGLQWNLMHCVVHFFYDPDSRLRANAESQVSRLKKRILVLAILNVLILPFLIVFVALYAVFRYGEQFYKEPSSLGSRQWSISARWVFRDYDEMPHVFIERLKLAKRYANQYTEQFKNGVLEGLCRAAAFILGSMVVWLLILSLLNEHVLLSVELTPEKTVLWWITILSGGWVLCRGMLRSRHVFYPNYSIQMLQQLVRHLPQDILEEPGSKRSVTRFNHFYPLQLVLLFKEFAGLIVTPWILIKRVYPNTDLILEKFRANMNHDELRGGYIRSYDVETGMESADLPLDIDEKEVLQSMHLLPFLLSKNGRPVEQSQTSSILF